MKLYVGNLPYSLDNEGLRSLFEEKGFEVETATVVEDRATGRSRGFGFVETPAGEEAIAALSGYQMNGRALVVNEARPMGSGGGERRGGGGGGFNRGGGRGGDDRRGGGGGRGGRY